MIFQTIFSFWYRLLLALIFVTCRVIAQPFSLESFTVSGGGGVSTGGNYSLDTATGQAQAGILSGGTYTLQVGFLAVVSEIVVPGSPKLAVRILSNGSVQICWPNSAQGFLLQQNPSLDFASWAGSTISPVVNGSMNCVTIPSETANRFYRLISTR